MEGCFWIGLGLVAAAVFWLLLRAGALRGWCASAAGGLIGLLAAHFAPIGATAILGLNGFTCCVALLLGLPGVIGMLLLRMICAM